MSKGSANSETVLSFTLKFHYQMENTSEVMVIEDTEAIRTLKEANGAEKNRGIVNMEDPEFKIECEKVTYFLWINEKSGVIMNAKDTHTIYTLSESSTKQVNELILEFKI